MYPFLRTVKELIKYRNATRLPIGGVHVSHHICWPWDLDMWGELNNGRTLSIFDLGRFGWAQRTGLMALLRGHKWGLTIAGASVRYRHRIRAFNLIEMRSRLIYWDEKFVYIEQIMLLKGGRCANQILYRSGVVDSNGMVPTTQVAKALGHTAEPPDCPKWAADWIAAEAVRPWPPDLAGEVELG